MNPTNKTLLMAVAVAALMAGSDFAAAQRTDGATGGMQGGAMQGGGAREGAGSTTGRSVQRSDPGPSMRERSGAEQRGSNGQRAQGLPANAGRMHAARKEWSETAEQRVGAPTGTWSVHRRTSEPPALNGPARLVSRSAPRPGASLNAPPRRADRNAPRPQPVRATAPGPKRPATSISVRSSARASARQCWHDATSHAFRTSTSAFESTPSFLAASAWLRYRTRSCAYSRGSGVTAWSSSVTRS